MRISDWSSDVCSSDLAEARRRTAGESERKRAVGAGGGDRQVRARFLVEGAVVARHRRHQVEAVDAAAQEHVHDGVVGIRGGVRWVGEQQRRPGNRADGGGRAAALEELARSEEHTSELQSLMRISYAVFCLKKKKNWSTTNKLTTAK